MNRKSTKYIKRNSIYTIVLSLLFLSFTHRAISKIGYNNDEIDSTAITSTFFVCKNDSVIEEAEKYLGIKYKYGGKSNTGFDCSGFTSYVFSTIALKLPHSAYEQSTMGTAIDLAQCEKGDLIFFKGRSSRITKIGHVGIVVENNDSIVKFIHASTHSGVTISSLNEPYYKQRYVCVRKVLDSSFPTNISENWDSTATVINSEPIKKLPIEKELENRNKKSNSNRHIVKKGETLYRIAKNYEVAVNDLKKWNGLKSNTILPGQKLIIRN